MFYFCCDRHRQDVIRNTAINGVDFLEVLDDPALPAAQRQRTLFVHFVNDPTSLALTVDNFSIEGGERIRDVNVIEVSASIGDNVLEVKVDRAGDFSVYTLRLVADPEHTRPPDSIDPMLAAVDFSFKVECANDFDCQPRRVCPPTPDETPPINYLAKDYASFRRLMLDRIALLAPKWRERHAADTGIMLVELLAHVGDHLSYQQDAVATEAYLHTARRRTSVKRHARLVDYRMHDGCNARAWVQVQVNDDNVDLTRSLPVSSGLFVIKFLSHIPDYPSVVDPESQDLRDMLARHPMVFEPLEDATLFMAHNKMEFYTWSDEVCCLPRGATRATLQGHLEHLIDGDVIVFEEVLGQNTVNAADADPTRRHAVRLTGVTNRDHLNQPLSDPVTGDLITEIAWGQSDALPFPFCISSRSAGNVSVARGNIVLCDHGLSTEETLPQKVSLPRLWYAADDDKDPCATQHRRPVSPRYRPRISQLPLTQAALPPDNTLSASAAMHWPMDAVKPVISLTEVGSGRRWEAQNDLLQSKTLDPHFVVEVEADDNVILRFGDDVHAMRPEPGTEFHANYRIGNGREGNVGVDTLRHIVTTTSSIVNVRNLLPAQGGRDPESMEEVRRFAPYAFRVQERAVTPTDYEEVTQRQDGIQNVAATFRWTGSWHTVFLTVDREAGLDVDDEFEAQTRNHVERFRMARHDLEVDAPRYVPLEIDMQACVKPDYFRSEVKRELLDVFSNRDLPDGRRGLFHPDNFSFGQTVYLSPLYAAAQAVPGVASIHITRFQRQDQPDTVALEEGRLSIDRLEVARLDNDRNFPGRGVFRLDVGGGK